MTPARRHSSLFLKVVRPTSMKSWNSVPHADAPVNQAVSRETIEESDTADDHQNYTSLFPPWMRSTAVLSLVVVAALTAVAGIIYLVIYFKSIKPLTARTSRYCRNKMAHHHHHKNADEEVNSRLRSTHPFFRRT